MQKIASFKLPGLRDPQLFIISNDCAFILVFIAEVYFKLILERDNTGSQRTTQSLKSQLQS